MADTLEIFGVEYTNVAGIIAKDDNGVDQTYTKGGGHLTQDQDGFLVIPPDGDGGGGGGSSDFSTAEVTVVIEGDGSLAIPRIYSGETIDTIDTMYPTDEGVYSCPLYKGALIALTFPNYDGAEYEISVTGDAEVGDTAILITGDCTITIS